MVFGKNDPFQNKFPEPGLGDDLGNGLPGGGGNVDPNPPGGGGGGISDTTGPTISNVSLSPSSVSLAYGGNQTVTVQADCIDSAGILSVTLNGTNMIRMGGNTYQGTQSYLYNSSYAGTTRTYTMSIIAADAHGNLRTSNTNLSVYYAVVPDTTRPTIHSFSTNYSSFTLNNSSTSATVSLTLQATDAGGIYSVSVNNGASQVYQYGDYWYFNKTFQLFIF